VRSRMSAEYFDELYRADPDPWDLATSDYERRKYAVTIDALDGRRFARALEIGCSIGVLTERLAPWCDDLLAVDAAPRAVEAAAARVAGTPGVRVERRSIPADMPDGPFDLIVCSEVLYYWDPPALASLWERLKATVAPGGSLLAVHWRGPVRHYPQGGDEVHTLLRSAPGALEIGRSGMWPEYRLDRFDRPS
jgi:SAM-dependent methyltransferase